MMAIPRPEFKRVINYTNGSNSDIIKTIENNFEKGCKQVTPYANKFKGSDLYATGNNIWEYLKNNVTYKADGSSQKILLPNRLLHSKVGDCKSFALASACLLKANGYNVIFRYTSYNNSKVPTHVYCVGYDNNNNSIICDPVWYGYNKEKEFTHKIDNYMPLTISTLSGVDDNTSVQKLSPSQIRNRIIRLKNIIDTTNDESIRSQAKRRILALNSIGGIGKKGEKDKKKGKGGKTIKKIALAGPRNAYLGLVKLNVRGLATRLKKGLDKDKSKVQSSWEKLGGKFSSLEKAILSGAKKKPFLGAKKIKGLDEYLSEDISINEPVTATAVGTFLATAGPIIATLGKVLKSLGASDGEDELLLDESGNTEPVSEDTEVIDAEKGGGFDMKTIAIVGAVVVGGYFLMIRK
jgi:hypothetical protein